MKILTLVGSILVSSIAMAGEPTLVLESNGWLVVAELPSVLDEPELRDHLKSGLTTSLAFRIESIGQETKASGGARVDIRYELWDEIYLVSSYEMDGVAERETLASVQELRLWWSELRLRVARVPISKPSPAHKVRLLLQVVPFSHAEQMDTQRWFSESVHRGSGRTKDRGGITGRRSDPLERAFSLLIATSIQRRPLVSFEWTMSLPEPP